MSTKTTFKRIALVTVAALSFGTMAAVSPASAAPGGTAAKISDVTTTGYVGETLSASVLLTFTGATTLTTDDSVTIGIKLASKPSNAPTPDTTTASTVSGVAGITSTITAGAARLVDSATANTVVTNDTTTANATGMKVTAKTTTETSTAIRVASFQFAPLSPGTFTFTATPSAGTTSAGGEYTYSAATYTFVVLSAGAETGDGGVKTPFATAGGVAGAGNYNQVKITGQRGTAALGTRVIVTGSTIDATTVANGVLSSDKTTLTVPGTTASAANQGLINVLTPAAGTVTVTTFLETALGVFATTASNTVTITVRASALAGTSTTNTVYMSSAAGTVPTATTDAAVVTTPLTGASLSSNTSIGRIQVNQYDALEALASTSKTLAVTAEISGAGRIGSLSDGSDATSIIAISAGSSTSAKGPTYDFYIFSDGRSGVATVTVKVGGVTALTRTVSFSGTATQLKLVTPTTSAPNPSKSFLAVDGTMTISVLPYDANNVKLAAAAVTATSDTPTVVSVASSSFANGVVTVTGVAAGKSNINIKSGTITLVVPVEVTLKTGKAVLTLDKTSAQPGEKITWTITATDANGRPVADGTSYAFFSSVTANMSLSGGSLPTGTETITAGVSTGSFFAPSAGSGTLTITAKQGTAHDTYIAGLKAATAAGTTYTAVSDVVSLDITNTGADAAAAAAEEATAAANDATDAALSAAEAAEAATAMAQEAVDAVAELSASVTKLISALRAQITSLTNLVIKIQKKVKA
jgi:hypothetical protein